MKKSEENDFNYITNSFLTNYSKKNKLTQSDLGEMLGISMCQYQTKKEMTIKNP